MANGEATKTSTEFLGDKMHTFYSNSKCSLLKSLCMIERLYGGTLLQPLRLEFFRINFPLHPSSQFLFINFRGKDNTTRGKYRIYHGRAPLPHLPNLETYLPPYLPHIQLQGNIPSAPRHFLPLCASGGMFTSNLANLTQNVLTLILS